MIKMKINEKSISTKIDKLLEMSEFKAKQTLRKVAEDLVTRTPVDTGAYAESFSVRFSSDSGGRSRSSHGRPRNQDTEEFHSIALTNMINDIDYLELLENPRTSVSFRNRAPHASAVERLYQVFGAAKDIYR